MPGLHTFDTKIAVILHRYVWIVATDSRKVSTRFAQVRKGSRRVCDGFAGGCCRWRALVCCVTVLSCYRQTRPTSSMTLTMTLRTWSSTLMILRSWSCASDAGTGRSSRRFQGIRLSHEGRSALGSGSEDVRAAAPQHRRRGRPPRATASGRHVPHGAGVHNTNT